VPTPEPSTGSTAGSHLDPDQLALAALGEQLTGADAEHARDCARCSAEVDQLEAVAVAAREITERDHPQRPPPRVWERISSDLQLDGRARRHSFGQRWSTTWLAAAAVVGVVAGAAVALGVTTWTGEGSAPPPVAASVVASTTLAALPEHAGQGEAKIVQTRTGQELVVDVSDLTKTDGFYEVWLIDPDTSAMVGLGALADDTGRFVIPTGLDLSQYRLVDVSSEPLDGDPVHSTDSVVRGELNA